MCLTHMFADLLGCYVPALRPLERAPFPRPLRPVSRGGGRWNTLKAPAERIFVVERRRALAPLVGPLGTFHRLARSIEHPSPHLHTDSRRVLLSTKPPTRSESSLEIPPIDFLRVRCEICRRRSAALHARGGRRPAAIRIGHGRIGTANGALTTPKETAPKLLRDGSPGPDPNPRPPWGSI